MPAKPVKKEDKTTTSKRPAVNDLSEKRFPFTKENYILMLIGIAILILGYALMVGGKSPNPDEFFPNQVYSWRRITLAPIVVIIGFIVEVFAIMRKPKEKISSSQNPGLK